MKVPKEVYQAVVKLTVSNISFDYELPFNTSDQSMSMGTGFMIGPRDFITAAHVIKETTNIHVTFPKTGKKTYEADIISVYPDFDVALVRLVDHKVKHWLALGDSDTLELGEVVYAIGYPNDSDQPMNTNGTISGLRDDDIQTDAALNSGNSGGPLLNTKNEVIGVNAAIFVDSNSAGFATPINYFKGVSAYMETPTNGPIVFRPGLGLTTHNINDDMADLIQNCKVPRGKGVRILDICAASPLHQHGISVDDILYQINEYPIDNYGEVRVPWSIGKLPYESVIKRMKRRDTVTLKLLDHKTQKLRTQRVELQSMNRLIPIREYFPHMEEVDYEIYGGLVFMNLTLDHLFMKTFSYLRHYITDNLLDKPRVVITHVFRDSEVVPYEIIYPSNLVEEINGRPVSTVQDLRGALEHPVTRARVPYLVLKTHTNQLLYRKLENIIQEDIVLSQRYNYNLSKFWQKCHAPYISVISDEDASVSS